MDEVLFPIVRDGENAMVSSLVQWSEENSDPSLEDVFDLLFAVHCSQWYGTLNKFEDISGEIVSKSSLTFYSYCQFAPESHSVLSINDFPLITLRREWLHEEHTLPIMKLTQQILCDTLRALAWLVMSDVYFTQRTDEWIQQVIHLKELLRSRIAFFIRDKEGLSVEILDVPEFTIALSLLPDAVATTNDNGYESDEERFKQRRTQQCNRIDLSAFDEHPVTVNLHFIIFCDNLLTMLDLALWNAQELYHIPSAPELDINHIRQWTFVDMKRISEQLVCKLQTKWYLDLVVNEGIMRCYIAEFGMEASRDNMHALSIFNDNLIPEPITSFLQIETRPVFNIRETIRITTDALFACVAEQTESIAACLIWKKHDGFPSSDIWIFREPVRNIWIFQLSGEIRWSAPSFTHAFAHLRNVMRKRGMPSIVRDVDIACLDSYVLPTTNEQFSHLVYPRH